VQFCDRISDFDLISAFGFPDMLLRYDEDLVEAAALLCASGRRDGIEPLQIARFHRERERLYSILDPEDRNAAFFQLHLEWFREWGLEGLLTTPLREFPLLAGALKVLAFRKSRRRDEDGAELYVNEAGERNGVLALRPERLERDAELLAFLRHELTHLQDMLDSAFGYRPELAVPGQSLNHHRLARERYRLLWDVSIEGRLSRTGHPTFTSKQQQWLEFTNTFANWPASRQQQVFDSLWADPAPTHRALEELACEPRELQSAGGPEPGAPCPLCGFPTFAWASEASLVEHTVEAIGSEFPAWTPAQGACARCAAIYRLRRAPVGGSV
jgi:hypothetical protein